MNNVENETLTHSERNLVEIEAVMSNLLSHSVSSNDLTLKELTHKLHANIEAYMGSNLVEYNNLISYAEEADQSAANCQDSLSVARQQNVTLNRTVTSLENNISELNKELKTYLPIKVLGGADKVVNKLKSLKSDVQAMKKQTKAKKTNGNASLTKAISKIGVKGRNQFIKPSYSELESAYNDLDTLFKSTEAKLIDCQFLLAEKENIVSMFSFKEDYFFTFPNLLILGTKKDDDDDDYSEKQMHRTLLYISNHGVGGLVYLDDNDQVQIMHDGKNKPVNPKNEASMIFAKAWLKKLKLQDGVLQTEDLNLAEFLNVNRKLLPDLLCKSELNNHLLK